MYGKNRASNNESYRGVKYARTCEIEAVIHWLINSVHIYCLAL